MSEIKTGKQYSNETKKKHSEASSGEKNFFFGKHLLGEKNGMFGKKHSSKSKQKMSEARRKHWESIQNIKEEIS